MTLFLKFIHEIMHCLAHVGASAWLDEEYQERNTAF